MSNTTNTKKSTTTKKTVKAATVASAFTVKELQLEDAQPTRGVVSNFAVWVRALLQNWRQGTVGCKGRSDVNRTNKKPWKQKGTGRARAGSARSPLWRGGGVIFGPQPRVHSLRLQRQAKKDVLRSMLYEYVSQGKVTSLDWAPEGDKPKTSAAFAALKNAGLAGRKVMLFIPVDDVVTYASFVNIPHVNVVTFDQANAFDLARSNYWAFLKKDTDGFKGMISQWI